MPLKPRSSRTTCVNNPECGLAVSDLGAKSATATRGFSTPNPVETRNQSCAAAGRAADRNANANRTNRNLRSADDDTISSIKSESCGRVGLAALILSYSGQNRKAPG